MQQGLEKAGNILEELEEAGKLTVDCEDMELYSTTTLACSAFLTIYCC